MKSPKRLILLPALVISVAALILPLARGAPPAGPKGPDTRARMDALFAALTTAYSYAVDPVALEDFKNREVIMRALQTMEKIAVDVQDHGADMDPALGYLQGSLIADVREANRRFTDWNPAGTRFVLFKLTENCMTCHARLRETGSSDLGTKFLEDFKVEDMPATDRVSIEVAVRQFDRAMDTYEEILKDPAISPRLLVLLTTYEDYLRVCLGTRGDSGRPAAALKAHAKRRDLTEELRRRINGWVTSLEGLDLNGTSGDELSRARKLVGDAEVQKRFVSDRDALVEFVAAETLLHRWFQTGPTTGAEAGDAFYLLAVIESHISHSYWISETPFLLEKAIRAVPRTPLAQKAYSFLEDYTLSVYSGGALPKSVELNLDDLKKLSGI